MGVRRERLLRFCTHCNETTSQTRLGNDEFWRCSKCERELDPTPERNRVKAERRQPREDE